MIKSIHNTVKTHFKRTLNSSFEKIVAVLRKVYTNQGGSSTVEYALVVIAAAALAGVLIAVVKSDAVHSMIENIIKQALGQAD